jgi:hypothetical protein
MAWGFLCHWKNCSIFIGGGDYKYRCCLHFAEVYSLWYRSIDVSTDPGLKSHLITFPSSK